MLHRFVVVVRWGAPLEFFRLYDAGLMPLWAENFEEVQRCLAMETRVEAVIVNIGADLNRCRHYCEKVLTNAPEMRVVYLKDPELFLDDKTCAELVLNNTITEEELAREVLEMLRHPRPVR